MNPYLPEHVPSTCDRSRHHHSRQSPRSRLAPFRRASRARLLPFDSIPAAVLGFTRARDVRDAAAPLPRFARATPHLVSQFLLQHRLHPRPEVSRFERDVTLEVDVKEHDDDRRSAISRRRRRRRRRARDSRLVSTLRRCDARVDERCVTSRACGRRARRRARSDDGGQRLNRSASPRVSRRGAARHRATRETRENGSRRALILHYSLAGRCDAIGPFGRRSRRGGVRRALGVGVTDERALHLFRLWE